MAYLKPNDQRAKTAISLVWVVLGIEMLALVSNYFQYQLLSSARYGGGITHEAAQSNQSRQQIIALLYIMAYVASGVSFIQWFRRAFYNLHFRVKPLSDKEGWAAGCWFVPIMNLYRPYQIMKEMFEKTDRLLEEKVSNYETIKSFGFLGGWWSLWIFSNIVANSTLTLGGSAKSVQNLMNDTIAHIVSELLAIPLAIVTVNVIKKYSKMEPLLVDLEDVDSAPPPIDSTLDVIDSDLIK